MRRSWKLIIAIQIVFFVLLPIVLFPLGQSDSPSEMIIQSQREAEKRPVLRVGDDYNYPPYSYLDENGEPTGYNVELIRAVADVMGYQVDLQLMSWSDVLAGLRNGELDLTAGMFHSEERANTYAFSTKHSVTYGDIFTLLGNEISSLEELRGKTVAVLKDDIMEEYLIDQALDLSIVQVDTISDALFLVSEGLVEYAGVLKPIGLYLIEEKKFSNLRASDLVFAPQEYCMATSADTSNWVYLVNSGLQILKANGTYDEIYDRWLGVYEPWSMKAFVQKYQILIIWVAALIVFLLEGIVVLRYLVRKKSEELEVSYVSQLAAEAKNKVLFQAVPDMIFHMNGEGDILDYSNEHPMLKELAKEDELCEAIDSMIGKSQMNQVHDKIRKVIENGRIETDRIETVLRDEIHYFEFRIIKLNEKEVMIMVRDITQQYQDEMKIRYLSEHDQLTGLMNRQFFEAEMRTLNGSKDFPISIIMIDVNGLKLINDSFGHNKGDELLIKVANILRDACKGKGSISRIGGDEFVVLLPLYSDEMTQEIINQIRLGCTLRQVAGLDISVSIGWDTKASPDENLGSILINAEDFMYKEKLLEAPGMHGEAINAIIHTLYEKNQREEAHSQRVSRLSFDLAKALSLPEKDCQELKTVGLLHDIGKIAIPEYILNKPGRLSDQEYLEIKKHPEIGFRILGSISSMAEMAEYILCHHERWDGKGYPRGLKSLEIPLLARIIAITDAYDAMTSERSYKREMTKWEAAEEIERNLGAQFDPILGRIFIDRVLLISQEELDA